MGNIEFATPLIGCIPVDIDTPVTYWLISRAGRIPVTNLFDVDGTATIDPKQACGCVALLPSGQFVAVECNQKDLKLNAGH